MKYFILLMIVLPLIEIAVLIFVGKTIGILATLSLIILTAILGAYMAKKQGFQVLQNVQNSLQYGRIPREEVLDGVCILIGGLLILMPGLITDVIGFLFLIPKTRTIFKNFLKRNFRNWIEKGSIFIFR